MFCLFYNIYFSIFTICMKYYRPFSFSTMFEKKILNYEPLIFILYVQEEYIFIYYTCIN